MNTFPADSDELESFSNAATRIYGNRFFPDQTLYEYLIEFLLIFVSEKTPESGSMRFHEEQDKDADGKWIYYVTPRMGLKRFIFYDKSKRRTTAKIDDVAYHKMLKVIMDKIYATSESEKNDIVEAMQDLLHGYAVVIKKRTCCAQALLPICKEFVLCEAMPNYKYRQGLDWNNTERIKIDMGFDFDKRNYLARGGELYYLHILQGLDHDKKNTLEKQLSELLNKQCSKISEIAGFIESTWETSQGFDEHQLKQRLKLSVIPATGYDICGKYAVDELINYLSSSLDPIKRIETLAKGVMFQVMRMLNARTYDYLNLPEKKWIIDMGGKGENQVKKIASQWFCDMENDFLTAINREVKSQEEARNEVEDENNVLSKVREGKNSSLEILISKGKEIQCIIPVSGPYTRFTLSEDVTTFLVLSMIHPGEKMTFNMFLKKLYDHFGLIIGPDEYKKSISNNEGMSDLLCNDFVENSMAFQDYLESTGFLRELSDATSLVVNPYKDMD